MTWGGVLRAVWNGPFHAGPLTRPVAVGDVLLTLLQTVWRAFVIVVAGAAAIAAYVWASEPSPLASKLNASVEIDPKACSDPKYPLLVSFDNRSKRTIRSIDFRIIAQQRGRSSDLVDGYPSYKADYIMPPYTLRSGCWAAPALSEEVAGLTIDYSIQIYSASESPPSKY